MKTMINIFNIKHKYFVCISRPLNLLLVSISHKLFKISTINQKQRLISISVSNFLVFKVCYCWVLVVSSVSSNLPWTAIMVSCLRGSFVGPHLQPNHMFARLKLFISEFTLMCFSFFRAQRRNR